MSNECPECKGKLVLYKDEFVCDNCGFVAEDSIESSFRNGAKPVIRPTMIDGIGLEDWERVPESTKAKLEKIKELQEDISNPNRAIIEDLKAFVGLSDHVYESAAGLYSRYYKTGMSKDDVLAASLYTAARKHGELLKLKQVSNAFNSGKRPIFAHLKKMKRKLNINSLPYTSKDYLPDFCYELRCENAVIDNANEIISKVSKEGIDSGLNPRGVAGATIYLSHLLLEVKGGYGRNRITQEKVAKVSGTSVVTIRNTYKKLVKGLNLGEE